MKHETMQAKTYWMTLVPALAGAVLLAGCSCLKPASPDRVTCQPFGRLASGEQIHLFTLRNSKGAEARIMNYGGIVVSLKMPDRNGQLGDVVLGFDKLEDYVKVTAPISAAWSDATATASPAAKFTLDGQTYTLATNNDPNPLHGGIKGFDKVVWKPSVVKLADGTSLELQYPSEDGEEGYPGTLR